MPRPSRPLATCPTCGAKFNNNGRPNQRYCSITCGLKARAGEKRRVAPKTKGTTKYAPGTCGYCGATFRKNYSNWDHIYCSLSCSMKARWASGILDHVHARPKTPAQIEASRRMAQKNNSNPVVRAKMAAASKGRKFAQRGGNGQLSKWQTMLATELGPGWTMEYSIATGNPKWRCALVDIAHPETKTAVEVNGNSHRAHMQRDRDAIKRRMLEKLGWRVIVVWNSDVQKDVHGLAESILSTM